MNTHHEMGSLSRHRVEVRRLVTHAIDAQKSNRDNWTEALRKYLECRYHDLMDQGERVLMSAIQEELASKQRRLQQLERQSREILAMMDQTRDEIDVLHVWENMKSDQRPVDVRPGLPD